MLRDVGTVALRSLAAALFAMALALPSLARAEETKPSQVAPAAAAAPSDDAAQKATAPEAKPDVKTPPDAAAKPAADSAEKQATTGTTAETTPAPAAQPQANAGTAAAQTPDTATAVQTPPAPGSGTATQTPAAATDAAAQTPPAPPPADPVMAATRIKLLDAATVGKSNKDDIAAIVGFYAERSDVLWVDKAGFTAKAKATMEEVRKADDWGLESSAFNLPSLADAQPSPEALGEAEAKLSLELLKYARFARGGRVNPASLSRILDQVPPIKDPKVVLSDLAQSGTPDAYLRGLHPQHEQFERLRQALLKARGPVEKKEEAPVDEALKIKLPKGKIIKPGAEHADIALLRQRLKVPAEAGAKETLFDPKLSDAVKAFQQAKGLNASGTLNGATRTALNSEGEPKKAESPKSNVQRLLINMERWRWMPESLGASYVWDNIPEFYARVIKDREEIFKEKIIVGLPEWATPVFSADMQYIVFNPSWGMPDGIKTRELLPRLRQAGGGFLFFGGGGGSIIRAYGLTAYQGGREVDPDSVDWGSVDIRNYSFVQPPGGKNPLGIVKFRFPNKHDVYMHDTIQRELFAQTYRAYSHGCIRVENPRKLAAILLGADKGWSPDKVASAIAGGGEITLDKPIPVHITYFTAVVDAHGNVSAFGDIYGHDSRLWAALTGQTLRLEPAMETASSDDFDAGPAATTLGKKGKKSKYSGPVTLEDAISGLFSN